ncbi:MAG: beta-ketoacyl-ACP synthase II [Phycisphaerae bacterium]|nr:beta-ketoacyl-ACP synthase II [Phycisphaerae bacterium]
MSDRRVVVTGMGLITPLGETVDVFWDNLLAGKSGIAPVTSFDVSDFNVRIGGECSDFKVENYIDRRKGNKLDRSTQFALAAAQEAMRMSGLDLGAEDTTRIGVIIGSGIGGISEMESQHNRLLNRGPTKVSPFTIPRLMLNATAAWISIEYGLRGLSSSIATACASATHAMGDAFHTIRRDEADVMIAGGTEAALTTLGLSAFASMKALSTRNDDPKHASRPFDRDRDGFVMGEGAGILIFEELNHAKARGADILCEVGGFGSSSDASHITQPSESGEGAATAMRRTLASASVNPDQIDYINAHGTATSLGDIAETMAVKSTFGSHAHKLCISSTKSSIGHLLGASGGVEMVASIMALRQGVAPPTINLNHPGEGCDLDYVPNTPRDCRITTVIKNSFGFGGHNACILIRRLE